MTQLWDLTPAQEAALDDAYWNDRYAEPEPDEDTDPDD